MRRLKSWESQAENKQNCTKLGLHSAALREDDIATVAAWCSTNTRPESQHHTALLIHSECGEAGIRRRGNAVRHTMQDKQ
jgi:hypothetical protein